MSDLTEWIKERRRIHNAATEGTWAIDGPAQAGPDDSLVVYPKNDAGAIAYVQPAWDDADSIVDAHNMFPRALNALEQVLELHKPFEWSFGYGPVYSCEECSRLSGNEGDSAWPCPTVQSVRSAIERSE